MKFPRRGGIKTDEKRRSPYERCLSPLQACYTHEQLGVPSAFPVADFASAACATAVGKLLQKLNGEHGLPLAIEEKEYCSELAQHRNRIGPTAFCSACIWHNRGKGIPRYPVARSANRPGSNEYDHLQKGPGPVYGLARACRQRRRYNLSQAGF